MHKLLLAKSFEIFWFSYMYRVIALIQNYIGSKNCFLIYGNSQEVYFASIIHSKAKQYENIKTNSNET